MSYNRKEVTKNVFRKKLLGPKNHLVSRKKYNNKRVLTKYLRSDMPKVSKQTGEPLKIGALFAEVVI